MRYAIYSTTGQITRIVNCTPEDVVLQLSDGEQYLPMPDGDDTTYYVANGALVAFPPQPSPNHTFDWATKQWKDTRTLAELKAAKWEEIKRARDAAINAPLTTPYGVFDCDSDSRNNISNTAVMLQSMEQQGTPSTVNFVLADNTTVTLTSAQMTEVNILLGQKIQAAYATSTQLREQIDAAVIVSQLTQITWPA